MTDVANQQTQFQMQKDAEHLRLLSIFCYVLAGLKVFSSCIFSTYIFIGLVFLFSPSALSGPDVHQEFPPLLGGFFVIFGLILMALHWTLALLLAGVGYCLSRRRHWTFCIVISGAVCIFPIFGTILGIFLLLVLLRPSVKTAFGLPAPPMPPTVPPAPPTVSPPSAS